MNSVKLNDQLDFLQPTDLRTLALPGPADAIQHWAALVSGRCTIMTEFTTAEDACLVVADVRYPQPLQEHLRVILEQALLGVSVKAISVDLGLAPSTVTAALKRGIRLLGLGKLPSKLPLGLVNLVQAVHEPSLRHRLRAAPAEFGSRHCILLSAPLPRFDQLSPAVAAVVRLLVEGKTHAEIAARRRVSRRTVANQLARAFRVLQISGRSGLLEYSRAPRDGGSCSFGDAPTQLTA